MGKPPALLTIEEACLLLRVGRTKGYAMAKQWRESGGASGLPVIDFGDVLRVPVLPARNPWSHACNGIWRYQPSRVEGEFKFKFKSPLRHERMFAKGSSGSGHHEGLAPGILPLS